MIVLSLFASISCWENKKLSYERTGFKLFKLFSMQVFWCMQFMLPKRICNYIAIIIFRTRSNKVAYEDFCLSEIWWTRSLGIRRIVNWNKALMLKNLSIYGLFALNKIVFLFFGDIILSLNQNTFGLWLSLLIFPGLGGNYSSLDTLPGCILNTKLEISLYSLDILPLSMEMWICLMLLVACYAIEHWLQPGRLPNLTSMRVMLASLTLCETTTIIWS